MLDSGDVELVSGRLFARTETGDVIHTQLGDAVLQKNSVASIERWQGQLRLASYCEPQAVSYQGDNRHLALRWGQELVVTDRSPTWGDLLPDDGVARRNFTPIQSSLLVCTLVDFQLASALRSQPHLSIVRKPSNKDGYKLKNQLLKTAVALDIVSGQRGRFLTARDVSQLLAHQRSE